MSKRKKVTLYLTIRVLFFHHCNFISHTLLLLELFFIIANVYLTNMTSCNCKYISYNCNYFSSRNCKFLIIAILYFVIATLYLIILTIFIIIATLSQLQQFFIIANDCPTNDFS